jgi:hypothetical protein
MRNALIWAVIALYAVFAAAKPLLAGTVDLSRICAAPGARLGHLAFEGQGAFASQC